jgi:serine/threonine-protein kinase
MRQCPQCGKRFLAEGVLICDVDGSLLQALVVTSARDRLLGAVVDDRYQIDGVLGDGGMGVVYRARALQGSGTFAIKVLRAEYSSDQDLVSRFELEAEAVYRIRHENIVRVFGFGTLPDGSRYFVMEYLEGQSLGQLLTAHFKRLGGQKQGLPEARTLRIATQICRGLHAAHRLNIVHRDMKPDNVHLVTHGAERDVVKVLDFGIAKVQGARAARTRTGSVFGTPHYMSPEQASGERDIDARTDVYAVGVLIYEMATGQVPFDGDNLMGVLTAHVYAPPLPPRQLPGGAGVSAGLEAVILKALCKRREDRYASMEELLHDLERVERGLEPGALAEMEVLTERFSQADLSGAFSPRNTFAPDQDHRLTVPAGRLSRPAPPLEGTEGDTAVVAVGTGRSIPPVSGSAERPRTGLPVLAVVLGVVAVSAFGAVGAILVRRAETAAAPTRPAPLAGHAPPGTGAAATRTAAELAPAAETEPEGRSATISLQSDPPGAQVFLGTRRLGVTPLEVERPAEGAEQSYELAAAGRVRISASVRSDSARAIQVVLPRSVSRSPASGERPRRGELLDPWESE